MNNAPLTAREIHGPYVQLLTNLQGKNGRMWLDALNKFNRKENPFDANVIIIDRTTPFDPVAFVGKGWSIEEQDERSLALTKVDLTMVSFETMLKTAEEKVAGEEYLKRFKASGYIRLDIKVLQTLWENQHLIPEEWKQRVIGLTTHIAFDGTIFRSPSGGRYVLCLYWKDSAWCWCRYALSNGRYTNNKSAVLAN